MADPQDDSTGPSTQKGVMKSYLEKISLTPEARVLLPEGERELLVNRDKAVEHVASLAGFMKEKEEFARKIIVLLTEGTIEDFYNLPPVDGATVLELCASLDEPNREKAAVLAGKMRSEQARAGGQKRWANDKKTAAKAEAYVLWQERRKGNHPKLRTNEHFATECLRRWPVLTSSKTILGWCTEWEREAKSQSAS